MSQKLNETTGYKVAGLTADLMNKLRNGNITVEEFETFLTMPADNRRKLFGKEQAIDPILKLISGGETLKLDPVKGNETIANSKKVFGYIDSDFKGWGVNTTGNATGESIVEVYEMVKNARFAEMFPTLNSDLDKLCMTQHQILNFVAKHRNWLRTDGYGTFFLFKSNNQFFVATLLFDDDDLRAYVNRFERDYVWPAAYRRRVVVPRLGV